MKIFFRDGGNPGLNLVKDKQITRIAKIWKYIIATPEMIWLRFTKAEKKPAERKIPTGISLSKE